MRFGISRSLVVGEPGEFNVERELGKPKSYLAILRSDSSFDLYGSEEKK